MDAQLESTITLMSVRTVLPHALLVMAGLLSVLLANPAKNYQAVPVSLRAQAVPQTTVPAAPTVQGHS